MLSGNNQKVRELEEKLQKCVDGLADEADKNGKVRFSVCDHSNWDKDEWVYQKEIVAALRNRGYEVCGETKFGVMDYWIRRSVNLR